MTDVMERTSTTRVVGYVDSQAKLFCVGCWEQVIGDSRSPSKALLTETGPKREVFRIMDQCFCCDASLDYEEIADLD
jgi:hypothetical protein